MNNIDIIFTPSGFVADMPDGISHEDLELRFKNDRYRALYSLGYSHKSAAEKLSPALAYLAVLSREFFSMLSRIPDIELTREKTRVVPDDEALERLIDSAPFAPGSEYINEEWIKNIFERLSMVFSGEIEGFKGTVEYYFAELNSELKVPEKVFFHLVETRKDEYPFAFLATYATKNEKDETVHVPLKYALTEFADDRDRLLSLLSCLNKAGDISEIIAGYMESGEIFHPLKMDSEEAYRFLKDVELIEKTGIICRVPNWWKRAATSVYQSVKLGEEEPSMLGLETLISVKPGLYVDGMELTREDIEHLLQQTEGLALLKGRWVEVQHGRLRELLEQLEGKAENPVTLLEALRSGVISRDKEKEAVDINGKISNGAWLSSLMRRLKNPDIIEAPDVPKSFNAKLRPYQTRGFAWLKYMDELGFGACLADDMGLGKTVQVLAFLEDMRMKKPGGRVLLIVPASLIGNWVREKEKFAPEMELLVLHGINRDAMSELASDRPCFLTVTTYGMAARIEELSQKPWDCVILDEAQAIKNPGTKQTKSIKKIQSKMKIIMTGTPIENDLGNLWSLFDFIDKGLLGSSDEFKHFCSSLSTDPTGYSRLKNMITPFMLRRLKTDKKIIADLPEKFETVDFVALSKKQVVLYRRTLKELEELLSDASGIQRRGLVLAYIMKFKQICNHPDQYMGQDAFSETDSGKLEMLREICSTVYEKRERVIVFTQFKEMTDPLDRFLSGVFGRKGFVIHGGVRPKRRSEIVDAFQGEEYIPYIVLSVKAGGTGLNLTNANHVIHFDRWWNPAVENQATDRAFRIGQKRNVMVHKLVCQGTIEEKIDAMIEKKKNLSDSVIGNSDGTEKWITNLSNEELMQVLRLD